MREILFRGKREDNGEWVYGYLVKHPSAIHIGDYSNSWYIHVPPRDPDDNGGGYAVMPETVGQYTGQTDKNGTMIFDGDICEIDREDGTFEIIWDNRFARIALVSNELYFDFDQFYRHEIRAIGNIHDTPELLKVKK